MIYLTSITSVAITNENTQVISMCNHYEVQTFV